LSAWIYPNDLTTGAEHMIIRKGTNTYNIETSGKQVRFELTNGTGFQRVFSTVNLTTGAWHHVAGTLGSGVMTVYVDGIPAGTGTFAGTIASDTGNLRVGCHFDGVQFMFNGTIDEVAIYNRSLSASEINIIYTTTKTFQAPINDIFTNWRTPDPSLTVELQWSPDGTTWYGQLANDTLFSYPVSTATNYTKENHRLLNVSTHVFRARVFNSTSRLYSPWSSSMNFAVNYTPLTLAGYTNPTNITANPTTDFDIFCSVNLTNGTFVYDATVNTNVTGQSSLGYAEYDPYYGTYDYSNTNLTMIAGTYNWTCSASKADYSSASSSRSRSLWPV